MRIRVMADYYCSPLWGVDGVGELDLDVLPLSGPLVARLLGWQERYDDQLNMNDPAMSEWFSDEEDAAFDHEGRVLAADVQSELGRQFEVWYWKDRP